MAKALYRKYRPTQLSDVVGQDQVTKTLAKSIEQGKISHAYLFIGPRGTGKTSVARIFAHLVNKFDYKIEDDYVDIVEIDGASNRGIDDIRELCEKAIVAPTSGKYKIYIIDEVHMLTPQAFNALLKTLEEPPKHVIFILATTDAHKVPITITSRAQTYTFTLADHDVMHEHLKSIAKKEKIDIDDDALDIIVRRGGGSFRDTISLLDQISTLSKQNITKKMVVSAMGLPADEKITELLSEYTNGDIAKIATLLKELLSSGTKAETLADELLSHIIENPKAEYFALLEKLPDVRAPFPEAKLLVALNNSATILPPVSVSEARHTNTELHPTRPTNNIRSLDINNFLETIKSDSETIYLQLKKSILNFENGVLHIYPSNTIAETILTAKHNKKILDKFASGALVEIHNPNEKPKNHTNDKTLDKISDIMGGEVINDGGKSPFN